MKEHGYEILVSEAQWILGEDVTRPESDLFKLVYRNRMLVSLLRSYSGGFGVVSDFSLQ